MLLPFLHIFSALNLFAYASCGKAPMQAVMGESQSPAAPTDWLVIGPFQIGTRGMRFNTQSGVVLLNEM